MGDPRLGTPENRLFGRVTFGAGLTVVRYPDGTFHQFHINDFDQYPDGSTVWTGGRRHVVSDDEAAELTAAGYGSFITSEGE